MEVKLINYSQMQGEVNMTLLEQVAYFARVSNPANQDKLETSEKLCHYLLNNKHFSPFEMVHICLEINTTRDIARQILRHRSFSFQEFSQRYAIADLGFETKEVRIQDNKNRQNSIDDMSDEIRTKWRVKIREHFAKAKAIYDGMITDGIAKECARFVLPLATPTRLYMSGSVRSWTHYINLRSAHGTQKEHMLIANECKQIFTQQFPTIGEALGWKNENI